MSMQDLLDAAGRDLAPSDPASPGEAFGSASRLAFETTGSLSAAKELSDGWRDYLDEVRNLTGRDLGNPRDLPPDMRDRAEWRTYDEITKLNSADPRVPLRSPQDIRIAIGQQRAELRRGAADVERRSVTTLAEIAGFAGSAAGSLADPPVLASMMFGAPLSAGIVRGALVDAGIALATEVPIQTMVQLGRQQFGEQPDVGEGLRNIAAAGAGGLVLSGALRGAVKAGAGVLEHVRARSTEVDDALAYLTRIHELESLAPVVDDGLPASVAARAAHAERIDAAITAAREGRVARFDDSAIGTQPSADALALREADTARAPAAAGLADVPERPPLSRRSPDDGLSIPEAPKVPEAAAALPAGAGRPEQPAVAGAEPPRSAAAAPAAVTDPVEAHTRELYAGREDTVLTFDEPGGVKRMTAGEMFQEIERQREHLDVIRLCLRGGR